MLCVCAPRAVRFPPHTLRATTIGRMACSARQFVASRPGADAIPSGSAHSGSHHENETRESTMTDPRPRGMGMLRKLWIGRWKSTQATHRRQQERKMLSVLEVKKEIRVIVRSRRLHCLMVFGLLVGLSACGGGGGSSFGGPISI